MAETQVLRFAQDDNSAFLYGENGAAEAAPIARSGQLQPL
jgi:hypothetical protein